MKIWSQSAKLASGQAIRARLFIPNAGEPLLLKGPAQLFASPMEAGTHESYTARQEPSASALPTFGNSIHCYPIIL